MSSGWTHLEPFTHTRLYQDTFLLQQVPKHKARSPCRILSTWRLCTFHSFALFEEELPNSTSFSMSLQHTRSQWCLSLVPVPDLQQRLTGMACTLYPDVHQENLFWIIGKQKQQNKLTEYRFHKAYKKRVSSLNEDLLSIGENLHTRTFSS